MHHHRDQQMGWQVATGAAAHPVLPVLVGIPQLALALAPLSCLVQLLEAPAVLGSRSLLRLC